ncbi:glycosyltransferase [Candidatus Woesearchaeota archaeon]|nr:glycosyltransferase [Candidatus Woesearchaeota archaeon]
MNIAILTPTFSKFSGPDRVVYNEATELAAGKNDVTVITFKTDFDTLQLQKKGIAVEVLGMPKQPLLERIYRLLFFLDAAKVIRIVNRLSGFDKAISFLYPMTLPAMLARKRMGQRLKYVYYDVGVAYPQLFDGFFERVYMKIFAAFTKITVKNADAAISISKFCGSELKKETGLNSQVKYVKIDTKRFNKNAAAKYKKEIAAVVKKHNLRKPVLLYVGRISPHKGVHLLLQAFKLVKEKIPAATLVVVGKHTFPKYSRQLQKTAAEIGGVAFTGFVADKELPAYYGACDAYVTASMWEGFNIPLCLTPKSLIKCYDGYTAIGNLKAGDKVTTHLGREELITAVSRRAYRGKLKSIRVYGCNIPLEITPEHRIYALRTKMCKSNRTCKPNHKCLKKYHLLYRPEWIEAEQLNEKDVLIYPYNNKIVDKTYLNLKRYLPGTIEGNDRLFYRYSRKTERGKETYEAIGKKLRLSKNAIYRYLNNIPNQLSLSKRFLISAYLKKARYVPRAKISVPTKVRVNGDFLRLFGYYLSEGHASKTKSTLIFSFHAGEQTYQNDVLTLVKRIFDIEGYREIKKNGCRIFFTSQLLNRLFSALGETGAKNKQIPAEFLRLPPHKLKELVKGLWRGDGCVFNDAKGNTIVSFSTASQKLAEQIRDVLFRLGIGCNIHVANRGDKGIEYNLSVTGQYKHAFCNILGERCQTNKARGAHNRYWLDDRYFYTQIRRIQDKAYNGPVCNIEVSKDRSYTTLQGAIHNCEANAVGKPAIAFRIGSHPEVLKKGILVEKGKVNEFAAATVKIVKSAGK